MSKHTPGPWSYRGSLGPQSNPHLLGPHVVENATGIQIAILNGWRSEVSEANASLIAAAPENYASNKELAAIVRELCGAYGYPLPEASLARSDAAIAKAEGQA